MNSESLPSPSSVPVTGVTVVTPKATKFSRWLFIGAVSLGVLLIAVSSFALGFSAGLRKARFSYAWGENYERNFIGPQGGTMEPRRWLRQMDGKAFRSGHGATGTILSLNGDTIVLSGPNGDEHSVILSADTKIKKNGELVDASRFELGDRLVVLGRPDTGGVVIADFIRAFAKDDSEQTGEPTRGTGRL